MSRFVMYLSDNGGKSYQRWLAFDTAEQATKEAQRYLLTGSLVFFFDCDSSAYEPPEVWKFMFDAGPGTVRGVQVVRDKRITMSLLNPEYPPSGHHNKGNT